MVKYMFQIFSVLLISILFSGYSQAQLVSTSPVFPRAEDTVQVFFNRAEGSGGLANYNGDIYAHTGLITQASSGPSDWKYVKTAWGSNTPETRLIKVGTDLYRLDIGPSIRDYYGVPASETILQMAFVFRSAAAVGGSYLEGKTAENGDIFLDIFGPGLQMKLDKPSGGMSLIDVGDTLNLNLHAQDADSLFLFQDTLLLAAGTGIQLQHTLIPGTAAAFWVKALVKNATETKIDSFYCFVRGPVQTEPLPPGLKDGINIVGPDSVVLVLFAPMKDFAFAIGDFSKWIPQQAFYMKQTPSQDRFWVGIGNLDPDKEYIYQYFVDGEIRIGDPYAEKVSDPWNDHNIPASVYPDMLEYPHGKTQGIATVFRINEDPYQWAVPQFTPPDPEKLVVYELLVRDFTESHSFQAVIDSIGYFKKLGINAIELMPVNEFEGNSSWGYNPNYYFAVDKYYGKKNDLKRLIDTLHQHGIAVILDVVYNHSFGTAPYVQLYWNAAQQQPAAYSPFFNPVARHDFNVGYDMNHENAATRKMIGRALRFWLEEYKVDGFRFDLSKGFTQKNTLGNVAAWGAYDADRIEILSNYADTVWSVNPDAYVILEHFADNNEETELASRGMMLWGNLNHPFTEAAMGYHSGGKSDFSWLSWKKRNWAAPRLVGYAESHDEERMMYKNLQYGNAQDAYDTKDFETALERMQLSALFLLTMPGPKMLWQFGELGYDFSIDYNGRTGEKPIRWDYYTDPARKELYHFYSHLIHLRNQHETFHTDDFDISLREGVKYMVLRHPDMNAVAVGNFEVEQKSVLLPFPATGVWYDYFTGDSVQVEDLDLPLDMPPGAWHLFTDKRLPRPENLLPRWRLARDFDAGLALVFPNPSDGALTLYVELEKEDAQKVHIDFLDTAGRSIASLEDTVSGRKEIRIREYGIHLRSGIYLCRVRAGDQTITKKIVVR
jgi:glycosidase